MPPPQPCAIALDSRYAEAYAGLAEIYTRNHVFNRGEPTGQTALEKAIQLGRRSMELDPSGACGAFALALPLLFQARLDEAEAVLSRAHQAYPNDADVMNRLGVTYVFQGRPKEGAALLERVLQIDPYHRRAIFAFAARAYVMMRDYERAAQHLKRCYAEAATFRVCYEVAAVYCVETDDLKKAREAVEMLRRLDPSFTLSTAPDRLPFRKNEDKERFLDAFRKAGMPA